MLDVRDLAVSYGPHRALENVSLHVAQGEICAMLGANGAGKTSLLKAIAGLVRAAPQRFVSLDGHDISESKPHEIVEAGVALVPEGRGIFAELTVAENLRLGAFGKRARGQAAALRARVLGLFPRLGERLRQTVRTMSGGEQQMVAIGRALMSNPSILMLDEPSLGLSPLLTKELFRLLRQVADGGVGILLVEQNARQSLAIADRGYLLENGRITGEGSGTRLARDPAVQNAYLGGIGEDDGRQRQRPYEISRLLVSVMAAAKTADNPVAMAERAATIQRAYVDAERKRQSVERILADHSHASRAPGGSGPGLHAMSRPGHELALEAAGMAERAGEIQRAHVAMSRSRNVAQSANGVTPGGTGETQGPGENMTGAPAGKSQTHRRMAKKPGAAKRSAKLAAGSANIKAKSDKPARGPAPSRKAVRRRRG